MQRSLARESAAHAARTTDERYHAGTASLIDELDTERQRVQTEDDWAQAQGGLMVAYATLQKSLGLGWMSPRQASSEKPAAKVTHAPPADTEARHGD